MHKKKYIDCVKLIIILLILYFGCQSGEDDSAPARIDEESDSPQDEPRKMIQQQKSVIFDIVSFF